MAVFGLLSFQELRQMLVVEFGIFSHFITVLAHNLGPLAIMFAPTIAIEAALIKALSASDSAAGEFNHEKPQIPQVQHGESVIH